MTKISSVLALSATLVCLVASSAQAQITRTFVSGTGTANSTCAYTAPCRFFTQAVAAMPAGGGEIDVLDPGSYGQLTIDRPLSIIGRGWTTITATPSTAAITITGSGNVSISGVQLDGGGTGEKGIQFTGSGSLDIRDSVINNFAGLGIDFEPTAASQLFISNMLVSSASTGILIKGNTAITGALDHVRSEKNAYDGIEIDSSGSSGAVSFSVTNSVVANNGNSAYSGIQTESSGGQTNVSISDSAFVNNGAGIALARARALSPIQCAIP
jgi:Right handed beta helix region